MIPLFEEVWGSDSSPAENFGEPAPSDFTNNLFPACHIGTNVVHLQSGVQYVNVMHRPRN